MSEMNIEAAKYIIYEGIDPILQATIDGVTMSVPLDPANRHYAAILKAVEDGELTIAPAES